uniref:Uncharacterized protein n=1 Tax=Zosterops lateralis melanops TaxID=1220523 RepID=A0A8D2NX55_ZOSLA
MSPRRRHYYSKRRTNLYFSSCGFNVGLKLDSVVQQPLQRTMDKYFWKCKGRPVSSLNCLKDAWSVLQRSRVANM